MGAPAPLVVALAPGITAAFTTRAGGVSTPPYDALNLAGHVGDDDIAVATNRTIAAGALAVDAGRVTWCEQVHGDTVAVVTDDVVGTTVPHADALVTDVAHTPLAVLAADCVLVLLADRRRGVVAAAHAGRRGLVAGLLEVTVGTMLDGGSRRDDLVAAVGPAIGGCCYEVGADVAAEVTEALPVTRATTTWGTTSLDLPAGARFVLAREGVPFVTTTGGCTAHQPELFYSYRRDGRTGRHAGIVWRA